MAAAPDSEVLKKYLLPHVTERSDEIMRLNTTHAAFTAYFGGKLMPIPFGSNPPKSILEMGAGSGTWTVNAAETYPQAEVVAVDIAEIPCALPPNVTFHTADLTEPFKFTSDRFDLVHARSLFVNLRNFEDTFSRAIDLVKPGGWYLIEDLILRYGDEDSFNDSNSVARTYFDTWSEIMADRGVDNYSSLKYESLLKESGAFSEINVRKVNVPLSDQSDDPILKQISAAMRLSANIMIPQIPGRLSSPRLTDTMAQGVLAELNNPNNKFCAHFYVFCARKNL